ncbi:MAG: hypothetical protein ACP5UQ_05885 [Anaerolineae bacterium]
MAETSRYQVLRVIALVLKVLAWVALAVAVISLLIALPSFLSATARGAPWYEVAPWGVMLGLPIMGVIWFVQLFAFGSILSLLISIEENTRALAGRTD